MVSAQAMKCHVCGPVLAVLHADVARDWSRSTPTEFKRRDSLNVLVGLGELALASGNAHDALRLFRIADVRDCQTCFYPRYARAFDAMSERDSARVWFEKNAAALVPGERVRSGDRARRRRRTGAYLPSSRRALRRTP
jgi:hypothetical protein